MFFENFQKIFNIQRLSVFFQLFLLFPSFQNQVNLLVYFEGMEFIFRVALAILQQARLDLLKLDMEGMLKVNFSFLRSFFRREIFIFNKSTLAIQKTFQFRSIIIVVINYFKKFNYKRRNLLNFNVRVLLLLLL